MTENRAIDLTAAGDTGHACSCCEPAPAGAEAAVAGRTDVTASYGVTGMTCSHCVASVTEELSAMDGVRGVEVHLQAGGVSRVTIVSAAPLQEAVVAAAVSEAGYQLADQ
jgi:copper chaperone